jgi:hypothetical protein
MASGTSLFVPTATAIGNAPDQRRAIADLRPALTVTKLDGDGKLNATTPSVTISASVISISVGDKIIGTIVGPNSQGSRYFVAAQGIFSVDPQSALDGLTSATLVVTHTSRGIEAIITPQMANAQAQATPVKLQLVQANIQQVTQILSTVGLIEADTPITLATEIGQSLRLLDQVLPQGFSLTPKNLPNVLEAVRPAPQVLTTAVTKDISSTVSNDILVATAVASPNLSVGSAIKIESSATESALVTQKTTSLLADLPDTKSNRSILLQSPLFANLLKSGRLIIVALPNIASIPAQILSKSYIAQLTIGDQASAPVVLRDANDTPLSFPSGRLLLLFDTAPSKVSTLATDQSIAAWMDLTPDDIDILQAMQNWQIERAALPQLAAPILPALKPELPADILLLFNIFGRKLPSTNLHKIAEARYVGDEPVASNQTMLENIAKLIQRGVGPTPQTDLQQRLVIPIQLDGQLTPLVFVFSPPQDRPFEEAERNDDVSWQQKEQIFALSIEFDQLGPITLRGRCDASSLTLAIETYKPLPETLQASTKTLFLETLEAAGMVGRLDFSLASEQGWQTQSPSL